MNNPDWVQQLINLMDRTDDPAMRTEATRVFVNVVRTLSKVQALPIINAEIITRIAAMLHNSDHPLLINEAVIALTLIASVGGQGKSLHRCHGAQRIYSSRRCQNRHG